MSDDAIAAGICIVIGLWLAAYAVVALVLVALVLALLWRASISAYRFGDAVVQYSSKRRRLRSIRRERVAAIREIVAIRREALRQMRDINRAGQIEGRGRRLR